MNIYLLCKFFVLFFLSMLFFLSCSKNNDVNNEPQKITKDTINILQDNKFSEARQIVYSLPSPQEATSIILDQKGLEFNPSLTNNPDFVNKYTTDLARALNLGIYSADISYASIFNQKQFAINYIISAKKLAEYLGILDYFTEEEINEIENNIIDKDKITKIITRAYMRSDAQLQENQRDDIGALILIGGWVEGMYLATQLAKRQNTPNVKLISSIMEQHLTLDLLIDFLNYYNDNKLLRQISKDIFTLDKIFQQINTDIDEQGNIIVDQKDFNLICKQIEKIRNSYINMI